MDGIRARTAAGVIDQAFVDALRTVARHAARGRPPPEGGQGWSPEDVDDLVCETVARVGTNAIVLAANDADDDKTFMGWLHKAVRSTLLIRARKTPTGSVIRSLDDALRQDPDRFQLDAGRWGLTGEADATDPSVSLSALVNVAWTVVTKTVRVSPAAEKTPPMAYRNDIRAVCEAVLKAAGPQPKVVLAEVLAHRFNVTFGDRFEYFDADDVAGVPGDDAAADTTNGPSGRSGFDDRLEQIDDVEAAGWMLTQLTGEERDVLAAVLEGGDTVRKLADALGCTKYRAEILRDRLQEKLRSLADMVEGDGEAATAVLLALVGHHEQLRHSHEEPGATDDD